MIFKVRLIVLTCEYTCVKICSEVRRLEYTIDEFVEKFVPYKIQRTTLLTSGLAWGTVAAGVMVMGFTLPSVVKAYSLSMYMGSWIASSTFIGMLVGAFLSGYMADIWGRKKIAIFTLLLTVIFTSFTAIKVSYPMLLFFRVLAGFGMGGLLPVVNAIVAEFTSSEKRGKYLVLLESSWAFGSIAIGIVAVTAGNLDWHIDYFSFLLALLFLIPLSTIPETPRYMVQKKKFRSLQKAFRRFSVEIPSDITFRVDKSKHIPFLGLFESQYISTTLMIWFLWFSLSFSYYGFFIWMPKMINKMAGTSLTSSLFFLFVMMIAQLPGYFTGAYLVEKIGRKKTLFYSLIGTAVFSILFAFSRSDIWLLVYGVTMTFFCMSAWGSLYAYTPELYPTRFRGSANGSAGAMARIAGMLAPFYIAQMMEIGLTSAAISGFGIMLLISAFWMFFVGHETSGTQIG